MDLSELTNFISPIILIACSGVGYSIHSLNNKILNSFIPIILASLGIVAAVWSLGTLDLNTVVTGMISGLASCGLYEAFKNMLNLPETYAANAIQIPYGEVIEEYDYDEDFLPVKKGKHSA